MAQGVHGLEAAADLTREVIGLSTGVIALTITFASEFAPQGQPLYIPWTLRACWALLFVAVLFAFWTLMAITGSLSAIDAGGPPPNPRGTNVLVPARAMLFAFATGLALLAWTGFS